MNEAFDIVRPIRSGRNIPAPVIIAIGFLLAILSTTAEAIPVFARQTGQNCVACHAGGQFPVRPGNVFLRRSTM